MSDQTHSLRKYNKLIEEIPTYTDSHHAFVHWIMRGEEIVLVALSRIDVAHHDEEAGMLEMCVGIYVYDRVVTYLYIVLAIPLYGIHSYVWRIVWGFVAGKVAYVSTHVYLQYLSDVHLDIEVAVYIESWHRESTLVAGSPNGRCRT